MNMLIFETIEHETVHLPAAQLAYWTLTRSGTLTLWACGGPPLRPLDPAGVLTQLAALGLLPQALPAPEPVTPQAEKPGRPARKVAHGA